MERSVHDDLLTKCSIQECIGNVEIVIVPGTSFRIGGSGVHSPTSMFSVSEDTGR